MFACELVGAPGAKQGHDRIVGGQLALMYPTGSLLNVALAEFLCLTNFAESLSNSHGGRR